MKPSILSRVCVLDVLQNANVPTEPRAGRVWFCCPVHADRHPSAVVVGEAGWRCHACGAHGGILDLVVALGLAQDRAAAARYLELTI
jgi:DNA primase